MNELKNYPFFYATNAYPDLYVDKVLFEYDYYSYYILTDKKHNYFVSHCYEVEERQSWIINKIDIFKLVDFLSNKIDIRDVFLCNNEKKIIITRNYIDGKESYKEIRNDEIKEMDILPDKNVFIDLDEEEYKDYINKLKEYALEEKIVCSKKEHSKLLSTEYTDKKLCLDVITKYDNIHNKKEQWQLVSELLPTEYTDKKLCLDVITKYDNIHNKKEQWQLVSELLPTEYTDKKLSLGDFLFATHIKYTTTYWVHNEYLHANEVQSCISNLYHKEDCNIIFNNRYECHDSLINGYSMSKNISRMNKTSLLAIKN